MGINFRTAAVAMAVLCAAVSCGRRGAPVAPQDALSHDAALAAIRNEVLAKPVLFNRAAYNPTDNALVNELIDRAIRDAVAKRYFDKWPASEDHAKSYAFTIAPSAWSAVLRSDQGRAAIESRIQENWASPPTRPVDDGVVADMGVCPGAIKQLSGGAWTIPVCEYNDDGELHPRELVRALEALRAKFPEARFHQVDVELNVHYRTPARLSYRYVAERDELVLSDRDNTYSSPEPIGKDLQRLATGAAAVRKKDLRMWAKSTRTGVRGAR